MPDILQLSHALNASSAEWQLPYELWFIKCRRILGFSWNSIAAAVPRFGNAQECRDCYFRYFTSLLRIAPVGSDKLGSIRLEEAIKVAHLCMVFAGRATFSECPSRSYLKQLGLREEPKELFDKRICHVAVCDHCLTAFFDLQRETTFYMRKPRLFSRLKRRHTRLRFKSEENSLSPNRTVKDLAAPYIDASAPQGSDLRPSQG